MKKFNEAIDKNMARLEQFVPIVKRVHGSLHPEFHEVSDLFIEINNKITAIKDEKPDLNKEFTQLRKVTNNYTVPTDVCESYEAVYEMLANLDKAYES